MHIGGKRLKALSPKHFRLVAFMAECPETETWGDGWRLGNRSGIGSQLSLNQANTALPANRIGG